MYGVMQAATIISWKKVFRVANGSIEHSLRGSATNRVVTVEREGVRQNAEYVTNFVQDKVY